MKSKIKSKIVKFASLLLVAPLSLSIASIIAYDYIHVRAQRIDRITRDAAIAEKIFERRQQTIEIASLTLAQAVSGRSLIDRLQTPVDLGQPSSGAPQITSRLQEASHKEVMMIWENAKESYQIDFFYITDARGNIIAGSSGKLPEGGGPSKNNPLIAHFTVLNQTNRFEPVTGVVSEDQLIEKDAPPGASGSDIKDGQTIEAATAVVSGAKTLLGVVVAGQWLDKPQLDRPVVDEIKAALYPDSGEEAIVSIFSGKTALSTSQASIRDRLAGIDGDPSAQPRWQEQTIAGKKYVTAQIPIKGLNGRSDLYLSVSVQERGPLMEILPRAIALASVAILVSVICIVAASRLGNRFTARLNEMNEAVNRISLGEMDFSINVNKDGDEVEQLAQSLDSMRMTIKQAFERLRRKGS